VPDDSQSFDQHAPKPALGVRQPGFPNTRNYNIRKKLGFAYRAGNPE
jgi:hypothetical protein